jgi:O-antigen/teichoic acid export membrane protein
MIRSLSGWLGIDRAVAYTLLARGWSLVSGPLTLLLIAKFLRPEVQGFYYTFGSVIALNVFFELGLGYVLLQFASHEKAHLEWSETGTLEGSASALGRISSLLRAALKWYSLAAFLLLAVMMPLGLLFFSRNAPANAADVPWRIPWVLLVLTSALDMLLIPLFSILEGCGIIARIATVRVTQAILANTGLWITLISRGGLFAGAVFETITFLTAAIWIWRHYRKLFRHLLSPELSPAPISWWSEIWPFQWRIAISWITGYFSPQLFIAVLFAARGAVMAGQMGMSASLCNGMVSLAIAWVSTKSAPFGALVAKRKWTELDSLFRTTVKQSMFVLTAAIAVGFTGVVILKQIHHPLSNRFLSPLPFALLLAAITVNHIVYCLAQYLRAHKSEPLFYLFAIGSLFTAASAFLLARPFGATGVTTAYFGCCVATLILALRTFRRKRREWHVASPESVS